jgi:DNA-binding NtrC family response regulator
MDGVALPMIGQSLAFLDVVRVIEKIARYSAPALIEGETGTGKELAARAIHYGSSRRDRPFIPVNCGAIPDALVENELFGHKRGAYTDAKWEQSGVIGHAEHGTLFLDEVDALTPKSQVALLRFLQDQQYRPLGGGEVRSADVRVIAASNVNLTELTERGAFRLDLLFRLKVMHITMPPLRDRRGDVALLASHFLQNCSYQFNVDKKHLHPDTAAWMEWYSWPGNIRELENLIYREFLLADSEVIVISPLAGTARHGVADCARSKADSLNFKEAKARAIAEFEKRHLTNVLSAVHGNVTKAAMLVGKERRAFGRLLKKHDIDKAHCNGLASVPLKAASYGSKSTK